MRYEITYGMVIPAHDRSDALLTEAVFLSFMVHARNLVGFFEPAPPKPKKDDVFCADFGFAARQLSISGEDRVRFGKDMMHLTYRRLRHTPASKPWPVFPLYRALKPVCLEFAVFIVESNCFGIPEAERAEWKRVRHVLSSTGDSMLVMASEESA